MSARKAANRKPAPAVKLTKEQRLAMRSLIVDSGYSKKEALAEVVAFPPEEKTERRTPMSDAEILFTEFAESLREQSDSLKNDLSVSEEVYEHNQRERPAIDAVRHAAKMALDELRSRQPRASADTAQAASLKSEIATRKGAAHVP